MMQSRGENQYVRPYAPEIDFNADIHQAYWNCLNSLQSPVVTSESKGAESYMIAEIAWERFTGCVDILESMILDEWKDDDFRKGMDAIAKPEPHHARDKYGYPKGFLEDPSHYEWFTDRTQRFKVITELLHRKDFFKMKAVPHARI